ncbi:CRISPR-associated helicase/endonuclease Cas3 [Fusobacterium necrophorum]|uniref:CRISPR-associated helicase/endonuclease Cas3 n=2 Tax=Fusobacterium necrophorum TaxID=859 RepID=UPI0004339577|nr:CRISPR-associated helicase/endonuclease Cas3 [Fusobacterium necrophorum]EYD69869.1 hypothetical protein FNF_01489 [Fusobacterium necrophorum subsp. funduliforme B35]MDK4501365.1 CRISPR-associated helicase/endonuclease Cas3 [Fusobacterium necrophorum]MDK4521260.1 CRISPR-associated helicase/endonuclease Cas3 [Fusobacterium necrophorum]
MRGSNIKEIFQAEEIEKYYAHLKENQLGEITYETLLEHTNLSMIYFQKIVDYKDLMPIFEKICEKLKIVGKEKSLFYDMIYDTIQFHDFGKINERFQKDKMKNKQNIIELGIDYVISTQHSLLSSAIFICYYWNIINEIMEKVSEKQIIIFLEILMNLAYVISKHHGDLEDFSSFLSNGTLIKLLEYFDMVDDSKAITKIIKIPRENTPSNILNREFYPKWRQEIAIDEEKDISMVLYIFTRLMYSLLISSDYYATTEFMSEKVYEEFGNFGDISILKEDYEKNDLILNIRKKQKEGISLKDISDINDYRSKIFIESENELKNNLNSNLFFLEAPTGSGKTNTAMNLSFQLLEENRSKIFYIYPFNTLVEQNMETLQSVFTNSEILSNISVVNSITSLVPKNEKEELSIAEYQDILMDRQFLNYPFVVTTHVTIFDILIGFTKKNVMPFYQLANSILVFDEIQVYRNEIWTEIINILESYAEILNIKIIIMSATLPNLTDLVPENKNITHLIRDRDVYFRAEIFKERVELNYELLENFGISYKDIFEHMERNCAKVKKIFIEFISKSNAKEFYFFLKENNVEQNRKILLLTGEDNRARRKEVIREVKNSEENILLISTQLIEAGVDIDMDVGYKNISGVDNEEQFLGRINRSCKKKGKAYFFFKEDARKIYKKNIIIGNNLNILKDEMKTILEEKDFFKFYHEYVLKILKKQNSRENEKGIQNFYDLIFDKRFRDISERMYLIEDRKRKTYFFNKTIRLGDITLIGSKIWEEYRTVLLEKEYAKKRVLLSSIMEKMSYFTYDLSMETDIIYSDQIGDIFYVEDSEQYFQDGILSLDGNTDIFL